MLTRTENGVPHGQTGPQSASRYENAGRRNVGRMPDNGLDRYPDIPRAPHQASGLDHLQGPQAFGRFHQRLASEPRARPSGGAFKRFCRRDGQCLSRKSFETPLDSHGRSCFPA
jgi:hypothetical protein